MKKSFIFGLICTVAMTALSAAVAFADDYSDEIREAIEKYKESNYIGCISDMQQLTEKDPSIAIAWYYIGNSYMKIAMRAEAHEAFDRVIQLNSVPQLTSYSIQAKMCMENQSQCTYEDFTYKEIQQLKNDPVTFFANYWAKKNSASNDKDAIEIEKLIRNEYRSIHPQAQQFIDQEHMKMQQSQINSNRAWLPSDVKTARIMEALRNNDSQVSSMAMMMDNSNTKRDDFDYLKYYNQNDSGKINPEMLRLMMMNNSISNF